MATIVPFQAIRPTSELTSRVAALPYDVYNRQEAYVEAAKDRLSFLNIDRPETQFPKDIDMYAPFVYEKARELFEDQMAEKIYIQDDQKQYYIYELTMNGRTQTGIVACASIDDYQNNIIKKHENTRAEKEADRIAHVDVMNAQTGPIFLSHRKSEILEEVKAKAKQNTPLFDYVSEDGIRHRGFSISDTESISKIQIEFQNMNDIYIADGHHRAASAVGVGLKRRAEHPDYTGAEEFNYFLSILFSGDELMIMDYNRVVKDLNGLTEDQFISKVSEKFNISILPGQKKPEEKGHISMYIKGNWYDLTEKVKTESTDPVEGLDVSVLQKEILDPILAIKEPGKDNRVNFIGGIRGLSELERRVHTDCKVAFAMYPTSINELFRVADAGMLMPPKSTWFEPKLRSGLFIHAI